MKEACKELKMVSRKQNQNQPSEVRKAVTALECRDRMKREKAKS